MRYLRNFVVIAFVLCQTGLGAGFVESLPVDRLTETAKLAIDKAPDWLREDLESNFKRMNPVYQDVYGDMIIDPSDSRFRDEIAFCVANTGIANLEDSDFVPGLLEENAFYIYEHDQYLDFVRLVDVGDPDSDDSYYTTTIYTIEQDGALVEYELPKEIYYWFIVHPKIEDEWAYYINPDAVGGLPANPPTGVFWRNWLFTITEEIPGKDDYYPILRERMAGVQALWGNTTNGAIGALGGWIRETMTFTSENERPTQPVRIYKMHIGRCGEYQDYTTAAARACLIPCLNTQAVGEDHVWNEFWHQRWIHWEPVNGDGYIDDPLVYEDGWGKVFSGVFNVAGDGWTWDVIDRYSQDYCTVSAVVIDANGDPVDGARLALRNTSYASCYGFSGSDGQISTIYGDSVACKAKIISELGKFPDGSETFEVTAQTLPNGEYHWVAQYPTQTLPQIPWNPVSTDLEGDYRLNVEFDVTHEILAGYYAFDKQNIFHRAHSTGSVDFFIVDSKNHILWKNNQAFDAFAVHPFASEGSIKFTLPYTDDWTVIFSAERKLANEQKIHLGLQLEAYSSGQWNTVSSVENNISLMPGDVYSASIVSGDETGVSITMPSLLLKPGDACWCTVFVLNPDRKQAGQNIPLFAILDVYGEYFFAPDFSSFSYYTITDLQSADVHTFSVLPEFVWPENAGTASGIAWYAAMTNPQMTELFGSLGYLEFGWSEE